jgi:hypothetical protein
MVNDQYKGKTPIVCQIGPADGLALQGRTNSCSAAGLLHLVDSGDKNLKRNIYPMQESCGQFSECLHLSV